MLNLKDKPLPGVFGVDQLILTGIALQYMFRALGHEISSQKPKAVEVAPKLKL